MWCGQLNSLCIMHDTGDLTRHFQVPHNSFRFRLHLRFRNYLLPFKTMSLLYLPPDVIPSIFEFSSEFYRVFRLILAINSINWMVFETEMQWLFWKPGSELLMVFKLNSDVKGQRKSALTFSWRCWDLPHPSPSDTTLLLLDFLGREKKTIVRVIQTRLVFVHNELLSLKWEL
jgi:hypothetical protein